MAGDVFHTLFGAIWLLTLVYLLSVVRLAVRLVGLKSEGRFTEAPNLLNPLQMPRSALWLVTGRFAALDDPIVARWGRIVQVLIWLILPLGLIMQIWIWLLMNS